MENENENKPEIEVPEYGLDGKPLSEKMKALIKEVMELDTSGFLD